MECQFAKLHGLGNDFILIEDLDDTLSLSADQIRFLCDRHFGIGADGLIMVKASSNKKAAVFMDYYNSDGTKAKMCGNGARCIAKFVVDKKLVAIDNRELVIDTAAGLRHISFCLDASGKLENATVDMGEPRFDAAQIPTTLPAAPTSHGPAVTNALLNIGDELHSFTCVSMGNPHAVTYVEDVGLFPVEIIGPLIETAPEFPEKINVEFVHIDSRDHITMRVWERGCGETLACGTGACASAVAGALLGLNDTKVAVTLPGGQLNIDWAGDNHVYMSGPAQMSFTGTVLL